MKIALVHDYIKEYGGAERVLEALHEIFPDAPVFTTVYLPRYLGPHRERFDGWDIRTSFLQKIPFKAKLISPFRLLSPIAFKSFDFSEFDIVITSATGAYMPNVISNVKYPISNKPIFITYCHTPPRYLYGYHTARDWKRNPIMRVLGETANYFLRKVDYKASQGVDYYIANSEEVAARIKKFYRRDAIVIYPPVDINSKSEARNPKQIQNSKFQVPNKSQNTNHKTQETNYYLAGGRLARAKGIDIIIDAFLKLDKPLKIFGKGFSGSEEILRDKDIKILSEEEKKSPNISISQYPNIYYFGEVSDEEKLELMRNAKAFIFASYDEDFGITPVEAMSVGTPVIAYKSGGVQETVIDGKTGLFYSLNDSNHLIEAVKKFEEMKIDPEDCINQAQKFSKEKFKKSIADFINKIAI